MPRPATRRFSNVRPLAPAHRLAAAGFVATVTLAISGLAAPAAGSDLVDTIRGLHADAVRSAPATITAPVASTGTADVVREVIALHQDALAATAAHAATADVQPGVVAVPGRDVVVHHRTVEIDGVEIFYREAGPRDAPTVLLLHGFPTSSHMFRDLIPQLAVRYHVVAPDYPGYGNSAMPSREAFEYSFDALADLVESFTVTLGLERYSLYLMDYGAPIGFRVATRHPERVDALIIQNGNAYEEGLQEFWNPIRAYWADPSIEHREALRGLLSREATVWQYTHGTRNPEAISPDNWNVDQPLLDRPGNQEIQLDLFLSYGTNPPLYPEWQQWLREQQPPVLITWGANDVIFPESGAHPYLRDVPEAEMHILDTGHFALEEDGDRIGRLMLDFLDRRVRGDS